MSELQSPAEVTPGLSQAQRLTCTFTAPSKTFTDIKQGHRSWWLPFLIMCIRLHFLCGGHHENRHADRCENQIRMDPRPRSGCRS